MGWVRAHRPEAEKQWQVSVWVHVSGGSESVGMGSGAVQWGLMDGTGVGAGSKGK